MRDVGISWDAAFCQSGASSNACSDTYCGKSAFSEKCSKAMADLVANRAGNIAAYFAIHSYSQLWMYPYGYKNALPSNSKQLETLSAAAVKAVKNTNGLTFQAGPIASTICIHFALITYLTIINLLSYFYRHCIRFQHRLGYVLIKLQNYLHFKNVYMISAYDKHNVQVAFALELRDTGKYGFQLPPDQIKAGCEETWAGIKAVVDLL